MIAKVHQRRQDPSAVDEAFVVAQFNLACRFVQDQAGVVFDLERTQIRVQGQLDDRRRVFDARVYFKDFYGNADHIAIRLSIDITEFDRICLPQSRVLGSGRDGRARSTWTAIPRAIGALRLLREQDLGWRFVVVGNRPYLNNIVEQDHRAIKRRCASMLGFKSFRTAAVTLAGVELP